MDLETLARALVELSGEELLQLARLTSRYSSFAVVVTRAEDGQEIGVYVDAMGRLQPFLYTPLPTLGVYDAFTPLHEDT